MTGSGNNKQQQQNRNSFNATQQEQFHKLGAQNTVSTGLLKAPGGLKRAHENVAEKEAKKKPNGSMMNNTNSNKEMDESMLSTKETTQVPSTQRLPAINLVIDRQEALVYSRNPMLLKQEITRCQGEQIKVKFAYVKNDRIIIATDDEATHTRLSSPWPKDAFKKGVSFPQSKTNKPHYFLIKGIDKEIDIDDTHFFSNLKQQGISSVERLLNRTKQKTSIIRVTIENKSVEDQVLQRGIRIGYTNYRLTPEIRIMQCYNCQQVGHTAANCKHEAKCMKCGGNHMSKDCSSSSLVCVNCRGNHAACSRLCPYLKEAEQTKIVNTINKASGCLPAQQAKSSYAQISAQVPAKQEKKLIDQVTNKVMLSIQSQLEQIINTFNEAFKNILTLLPQLINNPQQTTQLINAVQHNLANSLPSLAKTITSNPKINTQCNNASLSAPK